MYNVYENNGPARPVLVLSNPSSLKITVQVSSADGSATGQLILLMLFHSLQLHDIL